MSMQNHGYIHCKKVFYLTHDKNGANILKVETFLLNLVKKMLAGFLILKPKKAYLLLASVYFSFPSLNSAEYVPPLKTTPQSL